jgi:hypothetical protein
LGVLHVAGVPKLQRRYTLVGVVARAGDGSGSRYVTGILDSLTSSEAYLRYGGHGHYQQQRQHCR